MRCNTEFASENSYEMGTVGKSDALAGTHNRLAVCEELCGKCKLMRLQKLMRRNVYMLLKKPVERGRTCKMSFAKMFNTADFSAVFVDIS